MYDQQRNVTKGDKNNNKIKLLLGIVKSLIGQGNITKGEHQNYDGHVIESDR